MRVLQQDVMTMERGVSWKFFTIEMIGEGIYFKDALGIKSNAHNYTTLHFFTYSIVGFTRTSPRPS